MKRTSSSASRRADPLRMPVQRVRRLVATTLGIAVSACTALEPLVVPTANPPSTSPPVLRFPQRVPSGNLRWSRHHYARQYEQPNRVVTQMTGVGHSEDERYLDVANRAYSRAFVSGFGYSAPAPNTPQVVVSYLKRAETFVGDLRARGLKPNFVYQLKLRGVWEKGAEAFSRIGRLGRWRPLGGRSTFCSDQRFDAAPDKSRFESYVLFDFFATDEHGKARKEFYLDSSLHVLWNANHQGRRKINDSFPVRVPVRGAHTKVYVRPRDSVADQMIFAETEAGAFGQQRPDIGEVVLGRGLYEAEVVLGEESFHGYGDGGYWATVMHAPVRFEVIDKPTPPGPVWGELPPGGQRLLPAMWEPFDISVRADDRTSLTGSVTGNRPSLTCHTEVPSNTQGRLVFAFDLLSSAESRTALYCAPTTRFVAPDVYGIRMCGGSSWQSVEVEVTPRARESDLCLRFLFSLEETEVRLRNARLVVIPPQ